ncbi:hypothetical protein QBC37DRAFT_105393 [Rhypophila decipiens]|uniref:Golgi apparatus membrane protein TVP38 n=1 Tax=Rhypophila decipiens TaxID=261697 RepID=A0AAN6YB00_9PEZI|nr:hypothetical protein QBC37DRAFT_105393 [Rhypophila decipiens]
MPAADEEYRSAAAALSASTISRTDSPQPGRNNSPRTTSPASSEPHERRRQEEWTRTTPQPSSFRRISTRSGGAQRGRLSSFSSSHRSNTSYRSQINSLQQKILHTASSLLIKTHRLFVSLTPVKRILVLVGLLVLVTLGILGLLYSHTIFLALGPVAESWRALPGGWLIVWILCFCTAFPPVIGYSTTVSIAGFVYGFPWGWPIVASATVAGSTVAFFTSRGIFSKYVHGLVGSDKRFVALAQVLRRDGLGMLAMIRFCPLPYSLSNGFLATVPSIKVWTFAGATALATPKLAIHVFIGSRIALLVESGDKMSAGDKAINYISMILFGILGTAVGFIIYKRTMSRAAELAREEGLAVGNDPLAGAVIATADGIIEDEEDDDHLDFNYADEEEAEGARLMRPARSRSNSAKKVVDVDAMALMNDDDDISLWDTAEGGYRDSWDEEANIGHGNGNGNGTRI